MSWSETTKNFSLIIIEHFSQIYKLTLPVSSSTFGKSSLDELEAPPFSRTGSPTWIFLAYIASVLIEVSIKSV